MYMHLIKGDIPINNLDETRVCNNLVRFNDVHKRLLQSYFTNAAHVEAIHVLPPYRGCGVGMVWRDCKKGIDSTVQGAYK